MTPEVENAINEVKATFPEHQVDVEPESQGGAYVIVRDLLIGDHYIPPTTWVGFVIGFQYPRSDIYPHFIDGNIKRANGQNHGGGFSGPVTWQNRLALQISRKSNRHDPVIDTAATKLFKVLEWIKTQ